MPPVGPGAIPFTHTPKAPHSSAKLLVRLSTAALAADACACQQKRRSHHEAIRSIWHSTFIAGHLKTSQNEVPPWALKHTHVWAILERSQVCSAALQGMLTFMLSHPGIKVQVLFTLFNTSNLHMQPEACSFLA